MSEDIRQPLRRRRLGDHMRVLRPSPLGAAGIAAGLGALGLVYWALATPNPLGGEPVVRVPIEAADPIATATTTTPAAEANKQAGEEAEEAPQPSPEDVAADEALAGKEFAALPAKRAPLTAAPVKAVSENGPFGLLPRIAANGRRAFDVYARPVPKAVLQSDAPKVAIVLGGMGLNQDLTLRAINELPPEVTLAFAPYGEAAPALVRKARAAGHEVLLQLPMEPFGYPSVNPGPKTLLQTASAGDNLDSLMWLMSRFPGYAGVVNYMGARLTADRASFEPVLAELKKRGLVYLDDGSSARSLAGDLGREMGLAVRQASRSIDVGTSYEQIMGELLRLEQGAPQGGVVLATGTGHAAAIEAVGSWARELDGRGIVLVPASAAFKGRPG